MITPPKTHQILSVGITLVVLLVLFSAILPARAQASGQSTTDGIPAGLQDYERWFGSLHSHTHMDGDDGAAGSTAAQAFAYARNIPFLSYFMVTPHVHQDRSGADTLWTESTYDSIRLSAASATTSTFVAIAGQEISTLASGGHWNLYNSLDLIGTDHPDGDWNDADDYYDHVAGLGSSGENIVAQFNHPGTSDFGNLYDAGATPYFGTIAVSSGPYDSTAVDFSADGSNDSYQGVWANRLNMGWKLSPSADQDNHEATWGASSSEYTVIVSPKGTLLTPANVLKGLRDHMTYATEDPNMQIGFLANDGSMGQTIGGNSPVAFTIWWNNPSETICNNNVPICRTETAADVIQSIWIYKNSFSSAVATHNPGTSSGTWIVSVPAAVGDWFVVKFMDTYTLAASGRTTDLTWSAPVWYDPTTISLIYLPLVIK